MAKLFLNIWSFVTIKACLIVYEVCQKGWKFPQKPNNPSEYCLKLFNFFKSGKISPNLVTLYLGNFSENWSTFNSTNLVTLSVTGGAIKTVRFWCMILGNYLLLLKEPFPASLSLFYRFNADKWKIADDWIQTTYVTPVPTVPQPLRNLVMTSNQCD